MKPLTADYEAWIKKVNTIKSTIAKVESEPSMHGAKWVHNTAAHYRELLDELMASPPKKYLD